MGDNVKNSTCQETDDEWDLETPPHYHHYLGYHEAPSGSSQDVAGQEEQPATKKRKLEITTLSGEENTSAPNPTRLGSTERDKLFSALHSQLSNFQKSLPQLRKIERMPSYVGSRDLSRRIEAHLQQSLPLKMRDPGSFMVTIALGKNQQVRAMLDLGASVNLMPYSIYARLGLRDLKPNLMTL